MGIAARSTFASQRRGMSLIAVSMLGAPIVLFVALRSFPAMDKLFMSANFHLVVVSVIAACAVGIAIIAGIAAGRSRDCALVFVALGCLALGLIMLSHGLVTPGVAGVGPNPWVGRLPNFAIAAFALSQLAAVLPTKRSLANVVARHPWLSLLIPTLILCAALAGVVTSTRAEAQTPAPATTTDTTTDTGAGTYGGTSPREDTSYRSYGAATDEGTAAGHDHSAAAAGDTPTTSAAPAAPSGPSGTENALMDAMRFLAGLTLLGVGLVHWRRWRLSNDAVVLALALASWLAVEALASLRFGVQWRLSWWDYHALLLMGFGSAVFAVVIGFLRTRERDSLQHAFRHDALDHIARGYPEALRTLVAAVEARDSYTSGHSHRVTQTAAAIGQRLGLRQDEMRRLVWGAELHDIGKIGIPDHIIHKPGPLTQEERLLVEEHPVIGWEIARQARSLNELLEVVRHHHERVDGAGYPDGLAYNEIPLNARVVAVADVWDALTSDRAYRPAFETGRALEIMAEGRGTQFDSACLDAFLAYAKDQGLGAPSAKSPEPEVPHVAAVGS